MGILWEIMSAHRAVIIAKYVKVLQLAKFASVDITFQMALVYNAHFHIAQLAVVLHTVTPVKPDILSIRKEILKMNVFNVLKLMQNIKIKLVNRINGLNPLGHALI